MKKWKGPIKFKIKKEFKKRAGVIHTLKHRDKKQYTRKAKHKNAIDR